MKLGLINYSFSLAVLAIASAWNAMPASAESDLGAVATPAPDVASEIESRTFARQEEKTARAMQSLEQGRVAYAAKDYERALTEYKRALDLLPIAPITDSRRAFIVQSLGDASVAVAQQYAKVGRYDEARALLNDALKINPKNALAARELTYLDDPVRNNPARTPQYMKNVSEVNRLLTLGYGHYDLGQYDQAIASFESVLVIDPHNVAARRAIEKVRNRKMKYYESAQDEARAAALEQVAAGWENAVPAPMDIVVPQEIATGLIAPAQPIKEKASTIIIPKITLDGVTLEEAVAHLSSLSVRHDTVATHSTERGVNLTVHLPNNAEGTTVKEKRFSLQLTNAPLEAVVAQIARATGTHATYTPYLIQFHLSGDSNIMQTKVLPVPVTFMTQLQSANESGGEDAAAEDPFASASTSKVGVRRVDVKTTLQSMGIPFPEGTSVSYNAAQSTLSVRNTPERIEMIEEIVANQRAENPTQVVIKATIMEVNEKDVNELGFQWLLQSKLDATKWLDGGKSLTDAVMNNIPTFPGDIQAAPRTSVSSGLRSGNSVYGVDNIDAALAGKMGGGAAAAYRSEAAPGIFALRAVWAAADVTMLMRGLSQKKGADIMNKPSLIAQEGQEAKFESVRSFYYPESYEPAQLPNNAFTTQMMVTPAHPNPFVEREVGTHMTITVEALSADKAFAKLQVNIKLDEFDGFINYGSPITMPVVGTTGDLGAAIGLGGAGIYNVEITKNEVLQPIFSTRAVNTAVWIRAGHTIVLGGMKKAIQTEFEDKIPLLGDIPLMGRLFRSSGKSVEQKMLIIMITAEVIDASGKSLSELPSATPAQQ